VERELDLSREIECHLAFACDQLQRAGLSPGEARRRALGEFGDIDQVKERVRKIWRGRWHYSAAGRLIASLRRL
jgi:hypothetical protein